MCLDRRSVCASRRRRGGCSITGLAVARLRRHLNCKKMVTERSTKMISLIIVGLIVGALAKLVMPGRDPGGILITIILGIVGSIVAGFIGRSIGWYREGQPAGFIASILGAVLLLYLYRVFTGQRGSGALPKAG